MNRVLISPKKAGETVFCPLQGFDFTSILGAGETIISVTIGVNVYTGADSNPSAMISGPATINGSVVLQLFTGGQFGTIYGLRCAVTTSLGQGITLIGYLYVGDGDL